MGVGADEGGGGGAEEGEVDPGGLAWVGVGRRLEGGKNVPVLSFFQMTLGSVCLTDMDKRNGSPNQ